MFAKCQLAVVLRWTAVLTLLLGGMVTRPAHAAVTSLAVSNGKVSGGVAEVTVTVTVDQDTPYLYGSVFLKQPQRAGLLARGSNSSYWGPFPAGVPVSFTVTVYPFNTGPNFQAGPADFDASAYTYDPSYSYLRTLGTVILKNAR
jgi:hypothetical protein